MSSASVPYCCLVPVEAVGLIVGRGGATVRQIQQDTGAAIDISTEEDTPPSLGDRVVALRGDASAKEEACKEILQRVFQTQGVEDCEAGIFVLIIPASSTGFIIGPKGTTVTSIMESSGADINISRTCIDGTDLQPISISGDLRQVLSAAVQVASRLQPLADRGRLDGEVWPPLCVSRRERSRSTTPSARAPSTAPSAERFGEKGQIGQRGRSTTPPASRRIVSPPVATSWPPRDAEAHGAAPKVASRSSTPTPASRSRSLPPELCRHECSMCFIVDAAVAAWVVGKRGRMIEELRSKSGASIEVAKQGGATRFVELRGPQEQLMVAIDLLLECVNGFPAGGPRETRIAVPPAMSDAAIVQALRTSCELSGVAADLDASDNGRVMRLSGSRGAVARACQELAASLADGGGGDERWVREPSFRAPARSVSPAAPRDRLGQASSLPRNIQPATNAETYAASLLVGNAGGQAGQTPSEAKLLKMLLSGPLPNQAQLRMVLPLAFVRQVLLAQGRREAVVERSGSKIELGVELADETQIVTLIGQMLGNTMAVLYIQELLLEFM